MLFCLLLLYAVVAATAVEKNANVMTKCKQKLDCLNGSFKRMFPVDGVKTMFCTDAVKYFTDAATWHSAIRFSEPDGMLTFHKFLDAADEAHLTTFFFGVALNAKYKQLNSYITPLFKLQLDTTNIQHVEDQYAVLRQDIIETNMNIQSLCDTASPYLLSAIEYLVNRSLWRSYSLKTLRQLRDVFNRSHMPLGGFLAPAVARWTAEYLRSIEGTKFDYFNEFLDHTTVIASVQGAEVVTPGMIYSLFFTKNSIDNDSGKLIFAYQCSDFVRAGLLGFFWHLATEETRTQIAKNGVLNSTLQSILPCTAVNFEDANWLREFVLSHHKTADKKETTRESSKSFTFVMEMARALNPYIRKSLSLFSNSPSPDAQIQITEEHKTMVDNVLNWGYVLKAPLLLDDCYMFDYAVEVVNHHRSMIAVLLPLILGYNGYFTLSKKRASSHLEKPCIFQYWTDCIPHLKAQIPNATNATLLYALYRAMERSMQTTTDNDYTLKWPPGQSSAVTQLHEVMNMCCNRISELAGVDSINGLGKFASVGFSSWIGTYLALTNAVANNSASLQQKQELAETQKSASLASRSPSTDDDDIKYESCEEDTDSDDTECKFYDVVDKEDADHYDMPAAPTATNPNSVENSEAETASATEQYGLPSDSVTMELGADISHYNISTSNCSMGSTALAAISAQEQLLYAQPNDNQGLPSMHQSKTKGGLLKRHYSPISVRCLQETKTSGYTLHYVILSCICVVALLAISTAYCMTARHNKNENEEEDSADDAAIRSARARFRNWVREHTLRLRRARRRSGA